MSEDAAQKVRQIVADVFDVGLEAVTAEELPDMLESWDSVGHLNMIFALEQEFDVAFDPEEFADLSSVDAIVQAIGRRQG